MFTASRIAFLIGEPTTQKHIDDLTVYWSQQAYFSSPESHVGQPGKCPQPAAGAHALTVNQGLLNPDQYY
jgi:hypothetical protein